MIYRHLQHISTIIENLMNLRPCISCIGRWPKRWARELSKVAKVTRVYCRPLRISAWSFQLPCHRRPHTWPVPDAAAHCPSPTITPSHPIHPPTCQVVWTRGYLRCYRSVDRMAQCPHPIFTESKMMPRVDPRGPFLKLQCWNLYIHREYQWICIWCS